MTGTPHAARSHHRLGPSGAYRWTECAGAPAAEAAMPRKSSRYAAHGTAAHEIAEKCGRNGYQASRFAGQRLTVEGREFVVDEDMVSGVQAYLDTVRGDYRPGNILAWEQRLPLPFVPGGSFGTADAVLYSPETHKLTVYDLKYGVLPVSPVENLQGICYALGAAFALGKPVRDVEIVIVQPRALGVDDAVRRWAVSPVNLFGYAGFLGQKAKEALVPDAPRRAGEWCRFCDAAGACPTLAAHSLSEVKAVFSETPPPPETLSDDQLARLLGKIEVIRPWTQAVQDYARDRLRSGTVSGPLAEKWKVVQSVRRRQWDDEDQAADYLDQFLPGDVVRPPGMISVAQAEKRLKANKAALSGLSKHVIKPPGAPTLAPADDPRPPFHEPGGPTPFTPLDE